MMYREMTVEEAMKVYGSKAKVLVATHSLEEDDVNLVFVPRRRDECRKVFEDVQTVASACDDFMRKMRCFTEKQDIYNIQPRGYEKIIILRE